MPNLFGQVKLIRQIILNLLDNSLKHTDQGKVAIDLKLQYGVRHQFLLMMCFSDTGYGYGLKHSLWMMDMNLPDLPLHLLIAKMDLNEKRHLFPPLVLMTADVFGRS